MGSFGHHLCLSMAKQRDVEMMIVDKSSDVLEDLLPYVVSAKVGDCCDEKVLKSFGVDEFDACYVCIGGDFQNSIQITSLLNLAIAKKAKKCTALLLDYKNRVFPEYKNINEFSLDW